MSHPSRALAGALLAAGASLSLCLPAAAEDGTTTTSSTTSTSTTTSSSTSTSTTTTSTTSTTTTTTTPPKPQPSTTSSSTTTTAPAPTATTTTLGPGEVPPEVQALIDAYPRTPAGSTAELVEVLARVDPAVRHRGFGRFPVAGLARWSHDWLFPRHTPSFHTHEGTDVFAHAGTPVIAPAAGLVEVTEGSVGGLAVTVTQPDGTYWYLAHLDTATVTTGDSVVPGHVVGTVGDSGNAKGSAPHVHVEVHPHGGAALDPKPLLDLAYAEALAAAPDVLRYLGVWVRPVRLHPLPDDAVIDVTPDAPETAARSIGAGVSPFQRLRTR